MRPSLLLLLAPCALAAQAPAAPVRDTVPLAPITVTATRHATNLFAVPLAVTQVKKRDLFGTTGYGLDDALALVPGVVAQSRYGSQDVRIAIRGYGARGAGDRSNAGTSRGIRVLLDGFPETEPDGRTSFDGIDLAAAQSVEVVRSNASAVWGNAAGGVVSVSTLPEFDERLGSVEPMGGSFGLRRWALRGGVGLGAGKVSASFVQSDFDGWRVHSGSRRSLVNVALITPVDEHTELGVYAVGSSNLFRIPGPLTAAQVAADPRQANAAYLARDERRVNLVGRLGLTLDHAITDRVGISALAFVNPKVLHRSERGTFRDFTRIHVGGNSVLRVANTPGRRVRGTLLVGADFAVQDGAILFYSLTPQGTRGDTLRDNKGEGARNAGLFVTEEVAVGRWALALGARYEDITYDYRSYIDPALNARKAFTGVTPKAGLTYRLTPTHTVYASVGGGVEVPAGNETDAAPPLDAATAINPLLRPIRSTTYEAGTKRVVALSGGGLVREVSYDAALYHTAVKDEIVPYRGGRFYFTAGKVRRRGAELGLRVGAAGGVSVRTAVAYVDHRYTRYVVDSTYYGSPPGATADYSGNRVVGVPNLTYAVAMEFAPPAWRPLEVRVGVQGMSAYFADDANQVEVPPYRTVSLTVGTGEPLGLRGGLGVSGFVTVENLFDRHYIASAFLNPDVVGVEPVAFEPGLPRHVVVGITLTTR
jgi:iron complex outermembrane recepter protein